MEALAQRLQDALGPGIAVYLGSEWLDNQPQLPHVVVVPGNVTYGPAGGEGRDVLATGQTEQGFVCKAVTFEESALLADLCYASLGEGRPASIRLRSEVWGDYTVRVADLSITYPVTLTREDITRIQVMTFTQRAQFIRTQEVPTDDEQHRPEGETQFVSP